MALVGALCAGLGAYAEKWIRERPSLRLRTVELYRWLLGKHVTPTLGPVKLADITTALVREWRSNLLATGVSQSVAAKSYRLLRAILNTAVEEDGLIGRNPCRVRGADRENAAERPVLSVRQVFQLAAGMRYPQHRAMVSEADRRIADRLSALVTGDQSDGDDQADDDDGAAGALVPAR